MTPRFDDVPEGWKHPVGPYRQAPAEHGGKWWLVNPFTGENPWARHAPEAQQPLPPGFERIFGPRPQSMDFASVPNRSLAYRIARTAWEQELKHFKRSGFPEWAPEAAWGDARSTFEYWGMGEPQHFEGRYGWTTRFPDSKLREFDSATWTALNGTHLVVAQYQIRLVQEGEVPGERHPFVPPSVWPSEDSEGKED